MTYRSESECATHYTTAPHIKNSHVPDPTSNSTQPLTYLCSWRTVHEWVTTIAVSILGLLFRCTRNYTCAPVEICTKSKPRMHIMYEYSYPSSRSFLCEFFVVFFNGWTKSLTFVFQSVDFFFHSQAVHGQLTIDVRLYNGLIGFAETNRNVWVLSQEFRHVEKITEHWWHDFSYIKYKYNEYKDH